MEPHLVDTRDGGAATFPKARKKGSLLRKVLMPFTLPAKAVAGTARLVAGAFQPKAPHAAHGVADEDELRTPQSPPVHMHRSSSTRSLGGGGGQDTPASGAQRESELRPARRDVLGEKVTPATRLALEAAGLEDAAAALPPRPVRESRAAGAAAAREAALDAIAAALRAAGAPLLAADRRLLARFAATRNYEVLPTVDILLPYARWRADMRLDALTRASCAPELAKRYVMWLPQRCDDSEAPTCDPGMPLGRDAQGHPVIYKLMANWERHARGDAREVDAVHAWVFDAVCRAMDADAAAGDADAADTFTVLLDLTSSASRFDVDAFRALGAMLKIGFRGRLHRLIIFPAGRLERLVFGGVKKFMGKGTPQKVRMLAAEERPELLAIFPADVLPAHLGGRSLVVASGARRGMRHTSSGVSIAGSVASSAAEPAAALQHAPRGELVPAGTGADATAEDEQLLELSDDAGARQWPLGWAPRESLRDRLLKLAVQFAVGSVFADYGYLRGARAEARHLARFFDAPTLADLIPGGHSRPQEGRHSRPQEGSGSSAATGGGTGHTAVGAPPRPDLALRQPARAGRAAAAAALAGAVWRALLGTARFCGSPWRLLPVLVHSACGCAVGATLLGTPRVAGATLSGAYFLGRLLAHVEHTAGRSAATSARRAQLLRLPARLGIMRGRSGGQQHRSLMGDLSTPGALADTLVGAAA